MNGKLEIRLHLGDQMIMFVYIYQNYFHNTTNLKIYIFFNHVNYIRLLIMQQNNGQECFNIITRHVGYSILIIYKQ